jgi:hypothetical protein
MLQDPILMLLLAKERQVQLERAARIQRMLATARPERRSSLTDRCLSAVGNLLVDLGQRLREYALDQNSCEPAA